MPRGAVFASTGSDNAAGSDPGGEGLAGLLRRGNAGSNTAADHVTVLGWARQSLPADYRPDPAGPDGPKVLVRCDAAGATHTFAQACRTTGRGGPASVTALASELSARWAVLGGAVRAAGPAPSAEGSSHR